MKTRSDFISNSSSSCFMTAISESHDRTLWHKNSLRIFPDTKKIQMRFGDFRRGSVWNTLHDNWAFLCTQLIYWTIPEIIDGTNKAKTFVLRELYNSEEFERINNAVIEYFRDQGIEMNGIELDSDEIVQYHDDSEYIMLRPDCDLDHDSVFNGLDDMMNEAKCESIAELIWGIKEIKITWG